jgi:hypothetical protein
MAIPIPEEHEEGSRLPIVLATPGVSEQYSAMASMLTNVGSIHEVPASMTPAIFKQYYQDTEGKLVLPDLPQSAAGIREWLVRCTTAMGVFSKAPDIFEWTCHLKDLRLKDDPYWVMPPKWIAFDKALRLSMDNILAKATNKNMHVGLTGQLSNLQRAHMQDGKGHVPGAILFRLSLCFFQAYTESELLYDLTDLQKISWKGGGEQAHQFLNHWDAILADLRDPTQLPAKLKHKMFEEHCRKWRELNHDMNEYDRDPSKQTYEYLYEVFTAALSRQRLKANQSALRAGDSDKAPPALPAANSGNGKPCKHFTNQGWCGDQKCPFAHIPPAAPAKGKGGGGKTGGNGDKGGKDPKGKGGKGNTNPKGDKGDKGGKAAKSDGGKKGGRGGNATDRTPSRMPNGQPRVCYAFAVGTCQRKDCRFEHKKPVPPEDQEQFRDWCRRNNVQAPRSATPGVEQGKTKICANFRKGECSLGDACPDKHSGKPGAGAKAAAKAGDKS